MPQLVIRAPLAWLGPGRIAADVQVVCERGVVIGVGAAHAVPEGVELIVADGFLMPAAADRHVHIELSDPVAVLRRGVTAVRDLAWPSDRIFDLAEASELPSFHGPLVRATGPMLTARGGYPTRSSWAPPGTGRELDGPEDAAAAVADLAALGAAAIKVSLNVDEGPTPTDAELTTICEAAHAADLPVTAHAQGAGQVERALGAGVDELAHAPWTQRLSDDVVAACAARMRIVSTLDTLGRGRPSPLLDVALDNLRRFVAAGGVVAYGTDLGNGPVPPGIHTRELQLLRQAGLGTEAVLEALVRAPLETGAPADLVVLGDSPLGGLEAFDDLRLVVRDGRVVSGGG
jgi:imidazolonepropionase-like amidohydrolase